MSNKYKKDNIFIMTKILNNNYGCQCPTNEKATERALFAKTICNSYTQAVALLRSRNLGPGEIAVVRYYINDSASHWNDTTGLPVRMVMGIGGANAQADDDIYIFNDNRIEGEDYVTADDVEALLIGFLSNYATKDDVEKIKEILKADEEWKDLVNIALKENTNDHENFSRDIDELRNKIDNIEHVDLSNYYTKGEVNDLFNSIEIPEVDLSNYYTKKEVDELISNIDIPEFDTSNLVTKEDLESVKEAINYDIAAIEDDLLTKVDASIVEEISKDVDELASLLDNKADATDVAEINTKLDEKADATVLNDLSTNVSNISAALDNKIDASVVDDKINLAVDAKIDEVNIPGLVEEAIASSETITETVNTAIDNADIPKKVDEAIAGKDIVTTDTLDDDLPNSTYITENVITPITNITEQVKVIETQLKDLDADIDGGEEEIWYLTSAKSLDELKNAIDNEEPVILDSDIDLTDEPLIIENKRGAINLNGKTLTAGKFTESNGEITSGTTDSYGFWVKQGGELTIEGDGKVVAQDASYSMAVWADGGIVNIYGGTYINGGHGCDLIYAKNKGIVNIYGGIFEAVENDYTEPSTTNRRSALNIHNTTGGKITVYGGLFRDFNPADNDDTGRFDNGDGIFVADGYEVIEDGEYYKVIKKD